jgi:hypothetical protein
MDETTKFVIQLLWSLLGVIVAAVVFLDTAPKLRLRITSRVVDPRNRTLILRLEIENISRVLVLHDQDKGTLLQTLHYSFQQPQNITEFVPFTRFDFDKMNARDRPALWSEPEKILTTTSHWYPGDIATIERLIRLPNQSTILQVGLQVHGRVSWWIHTLLKLRGVKRKLGQPERWTTTVLISLPQNVENVRTVEAQSLIKGPGSHFI